MSNIGQVFKQGASNLAAQTGDVLLHFSQSINPNAAPFEPGSLTRASQMGTTSLPQATIPKGAMLPGTVPQATIPKGPMLPGTVPQATIPKGTMLPGTVPQATIPKGAMLPGTVPQATIPKGAMLPGTVPQQYYGAFYPQSNLQLPSGPYLKPVTTVPMYTTLPPGRPMSVPPIQGTLLSTSDVRLGLPAGTIPAGTFLAAAGLTEDDVRALARKLGLGEGEYSVILNRIRLYIYS